VRWLTIIVVGCALSVSFWRTLTPSAPFFEIKEGDGSVVESYVMGGTRTQFSDTGAASEIMRIGSAERQLGSQRHCLKKYPLSERRVTTTYGGILKRKPAYFTSRPMNLHCKMGSQCYEATNQATLNTETMLLNMDQKRAEGHDPVLLTGRGSKTTGSRF